MRARSVYVCSEGIYGVGDCGTGRRKIGGGPVGGARVYIGRAGRVPTGEKGEMRFRFQQFRFFGAPRAGARWRALVPPVLMLPAAAAASRQLLAPVRCDALLPDARGDTYEMGLYLASQRELREARERRRDGRGRGGVLRVLRMLLYGLHDAVVEPVRTVLRLLQLSAVFVPVLLAFPVTLVGRTVRAGSHGERSETQGALLWYRLVRKALEWAGPSFIKLGQWAGSRTDIFSEGLCAELGRLHSSAKPHGLQYTKRAIVEALGVQSFEEVFEEFREQPLGCGAIAQVYVGKLREELVRAKGVDLGPGGNRWCAVKVVHPHAARQISRDLRLMRFFAAAVDALPTMEWLSLPAEVEQFSILMNIQLDMRIECNNLAKFNDNFRGHTQIRFPRGFVELTSRSVLFEEYIDGFPMEAFLKVKNRIGDTSLCQKVSEPFISSFLKMMILDDFIHSDLHAGNVMLRFVRTDKLERHILSPEDETSDVVRRLVGMHRDHDPGFDVALREVLRDYTPQICFIDTGLITELNERNRTNFIALFNALAQFNGRRAGELMIERSRTPETAVDKDAFALKVDRLVKTVKQRTFTLGTVSIGDLLEQMLSMVRTHHVRMEGDFVSVVVAILLLEGIGRQLDPELDLFARYVPHGPL